MFMLRLWIELGFRFSLVVIFRFMVIVMIPCECG